METIDSKQIEQLRQLIDETGRPIILVPHVNPDGDAAGSTLGLARILKNFGKNGQVICPNKYPEFLYWLSGHDDVLFYPEKKKEATAYFTESELLICLDFNHISRTGDMKKLVEKFKGTIVMIDHHPDPQDFAKLTISYPGCSSTSELVYWIAKALHVEDCIDSEAAEALFCGIMTDTGSFDYNVSQPGTFKAVSELLEKGANPEKVHTAVYDNFSADRMRLMGHCLSERMEIFPEYHAAMMYISKEDQLKYNFAPGDSEGFVNYPLSIKGIHFSVLFTEKENMVKVSLRSKGDFAVNTFSSKYFNGGGHRNAAGGEYFASLTDSLARFRELLPVCQNELIQTKIE